MSGLSQHRVTRHTHEDPSRRLTRRYVLALIIIAILVSGGHFVMVRALTEADSDARVINLAGRQRMLSQRLVKTFGELTLAEPSRPTAQLRAKILSDLESWEKTHTGLQHGDISLGLPATTAVEISTNLSKLDGNVAALTSLIRQGLQSELPPDETLMRTAHALSHDFVTRMDEIVFAWEALSRQKVTGLKQIAHAIWLIALLTLAAEALLIFMPFVKQLSRSHRDLQIRAQELERLAMVARRTTNAVIITDENRIIQWVNDGFTRITGYTAEEVIGKTPDIFRAPNTESEAIDEMRVCVNAGIGCRVEVLNARKDGHPIWLDIDIQPLHDDTGQLSGFIAIQSDITERKQLQYQANTDVLTGLPNRRNFFERLKEEHNRTNRAHNNGALMMLDIDHFKKVNDKYGHLAGDQVLRTVADTIRKTIRQTDFPGRVGGEEFAVMLPDTSIGSAQQLAERLRKQIEGAITLIDDTQVSVTISIGLAAITPETDVADTFQSADQALYQAKAAGRNKVIVAAEQGAETD